MSNDFKDKTILFYLQKHNVPVVDFIKVPGMGLGFFEYYVKLIYNNKHVYLKTFIEEDEEHIDAELFQDINIFLSDCAELYSKKEHHFNFFEMQFVCKACYDAKDDVIITGDLGRLLIDLSNEHKSIESFLGFLDDFNIEQFYERLYLNPSN